MPSTIEWTDETWNPVTGCTRVSPGCDNCYMFALYPRLHGMKVPGYDANPDVVQIFPDRLHAPLTWTRKRRVFVNSMSDLFHPDVPYEIIHDVFQVMLQASQERGHIFQVLTKRPGRAVGWWNEYAGEYDNDWPARVWIGTSVESQKYAPRVEVLSRIPAAVRFVSAEPLLEEVDLSHWLNNGALQWVIAGGESGIRARPMELDWARKLRDDADAAGVAFFLKQLGGRKGKRSGAEAVLDGTTRTEQPDAVMDSETRTQQHGELANAA